MSSHRTRAEPRAVEEQHYAAPSLPWPLRPLQAAPWAQKRRRRRRRHGAINRALPARAAAGPQHGGREHEKKRQRAGAPRCSAKHGPCTDGMWRATAAPMARESFNCSAARGRVTGAQHPAAPNRQQPWQLSSAQAAASSRAGRLAVTGQARPVLCSDWIRHPPSLTPTTRTRTTGQRQRATPNSAATEARPPRALVRASVCPPANPSPSARQAARRTARDRAKPGTTLEGAPSALRSATLPLNCAPVPAPVICVWGSLAPLPSGQHAHPPTVAHARPPYIATDSLQVPLYTAAVPAPSRRNTAWGIGTSLVHVGALAAAHAAWPPCVERERAWLAPTRACATTGQSTLPSSQ